MSYYIILQIEVAKSYDNVFLLCVIPSQNATYLQNDLLIVEFICTKAQYGKNQYGCSLCKDGDIYKVFHIIEEDQ